VQVDRKVSELNDGHAVGDAGNGAGQREMIEAKLQEIVEDINESRKAHSGTLATFKQELDKQARIVLIENLMKEMNGINYVYITC